MTTNGEPLRELLQDWRRHLRAKNLAPSTINTYLASAELLVDWLERDGQAATTDQLEGATGGHRVIEAWMVHLQAQPKQRRGEGTVSAGQAAKHYRQLQQFCRWLTEVEELLTASPFARTSPPVVPEVLTPVLSVDELKALLAACKQGLNARRDEALLRTFIDTGCRADEIASLEVEGVDFDADTISVLGKGRRPRVVPFGDSTGEALRRYLRERRRSKWAAKTDRLWLGRKGPLTADGIRAVMDRRADDAGVPHVHPHMFRHTLAHRWLAAGGQEQDLMRLMGWRSREMVARYGASAADERARDAHRRAGLADDL